MVAREDGGRLPCQCVAILLMEPDHSSMVQVVIVVVTDDYKVQARKDCLV